ncbi:hypothetical protein G7085_06330 [Tessaracoccus sp. HDW20]|uniref:hypothetical protein n=1 Tax=Tessaracoccus coleopterorum TaxID=2714950 RepID=UPI0018D386AE|nr:hypothetical protein [Tessaracoccus coleopterorum]NHB84348.1 hypothetical protein [Tessaracoccus coleopterorum]
MAPLLRLGARMFGPISPTTRLAFTNAARNPQRAASTAMALMLAVGLIVTLQVALATARSSGMESINSRYPVDVALSLRGMDGDPDELISDLRAVDGVKAVAPIASKRIEVDGGVIDAFAPPRGTPRSGSARPPPRRPRRAPSWCTRTARPARPVTGSRCRRSRGRWN